jgi:Kinetochore Sim4 complex subunit FTA2
MSVAAVDQYDLLPQIKGPKLRRFRDGRYNRIEYLELLGDALRGEDASSTGVHGYVFRVRIDGEPFALKIVGYDQLSTRNRH